MHKHLHIQISRYPKLDTAPDFAVAAALYDGLNAAISHGHQNVSFTCTSGNCTWTKFTSLAVRSTCFDMSSLLKRTTPEDLADETTFSTSISSSMDLEPATTSIEYSSDPNQGLTYGAPSSTGIASINTPQTFSEVEAPLYSAPPTSEISAFTGGGATPIKSTMTEESTGLEKRATSSVQSSSKPRESSATWTDWTLEHLNLTLSNTNRLRRNQSTFAVLQAAVVADPKRTVNFVASQALLAAFTIIRTNNTHTLSTPAWDAASASAMECGLELTLNVYNSSVRNNVLVEQIVASASDKVPGSWLPSLVDQSGVNPEDLPIDRTTNESDPIDHQMFLYRDDYAFDPDALQTDVKENFTVTQRSLVSTLDFLTSLIQQETDNGTVKAVLQQDQSVMHTYGSAILQPLFNQTNTNATFDAIARSMSNAIRNVGNDSVSGMTQQWVRHYQVRWAFLALPLSLFMSKS